MTGPALICTITGTQSKTTSYQLDEGLKRYIKAAAALEDRSASDLFQELLIDALKHRKVTVEYENDPRKDATTK